MAKDPQEVLKTEFSETFAAMVVQRAARHSEEFVQGMRDRMVVSFFKYGLVSEAYPEKVDAMASLVKRLDRYDETGNTEWLMDSANFAMIEYMRPRNELACASPLNPPALYKSRVGKARELVATYAAGGNLYLLADIAGLCLSEFDSPEHPKAHFRGTDSHESPGRMVDGVATGRATADIGRSQSEINREAFERRLGIA